MWGWDHLSRPHDHKTLTSPRVHMHTEALSFRKPHWHARTFPSNTEANIGTNTSIWFSLQQRCIFVVVFNNAPPSCAASLQGLTDYAPKWSKNILWACGTACQQKPQIQGWLLRQAVINEAHERQRGLFFFFWKGGQQLRVLFYRSTGFKVFRHSKMTHLLFEGLLHHHNVRDTRSFLQGLSFCSDPSSCQNIQRYNFRFPCQLSDSSQACQGASNQRELVS